jgi:hypothetical protein
MSEEIEHLKKTLIVEGRAHSPCERSAWNSLRPFTILFL